MVYELSSFQPSWIGLYKWRFGNWKSVSGEPSNYSNWHASIDPNANREYSLGAVINDGWRYWERHHPEDPFLDMPTQGVLQLRFTIVLMLFVWESAQLIETSYVLSPYLGGEFLWWMLLGG